MCTFNHNHIDFVQKAIVLLCHAVPIAIGIGMVQHLMLDPEPIWPMCQLAPSLKTSKPLRYLARSLKLYTVQFFNAPPSYVRSG